MRFSSAEETASLERESTPVGATGSLRRASSPSGTTGSLRHASHPAETADPLRKKTNAGRSGRCSGARRKHRSKRRQLTGEGDRSSRTTRWNRRIRGQLTGRECTSSGTYMGWGEGPFGGPPRGLFFAYIVLSVSMGRNSARRKWGRKVRHGCHRRAQSRNDEVFTT